MTQPIRIGTRGSPLALAQAHMVAAALHASHGVATEIVPIVTSGDVIQDRALAEVVGKALWTKELDRCLIVIDDYETLAPTLDDFLRRELLRRLSENKTRFSTTVVFQICSWPPPLTAM